MDIAVTGIGMVSALGGDTEECLGTLREGGNRCRAHEFERLDGRAVSAPAYLVDEVNAGGLIEPRKLRRMFRLARMAAVSARLALRHAGIDPSSLEPSRLGVCFGTSFGALDVTRKFIDSWIAQGEAHASPLQFMNSVHGILASQIALDVNATGVNLTNAQRDVCFEVALETAVDLLRAGRADVILVGAADEMTPLLHEVGSRTGQLVLDPGVPGIDPDGARNGCIPGEGAAVAVLQRAEGADNPLAKVLATATGRHNITGPDVAKQCMERAGLNSPALLSNNRDGSLRSARVHRQREEALGMRGLSWHGNFGTFPAAGALQFAINVMMLAGQETFRPLANGTPLEAPASPATILHDAASTSGNHAAYALSRP
jgi:3-oxoacyl-(acyl-carrier-protein) synthase